MNARQYRGLIWTNHALERLEQRKLTQDQIWQTFSEPDTKHTGSRADSYEYTKRMGSHTFSLIATQNEKNEWLVLSCWVEPPFPGSIDIEKRAAWKQYQRAPWWLKWLIHFKRQLGF